jgi:hypothetical protein
VVKDGQRDSSRITGCSDDVPGMSAILKLSSYKGCRNERTSICRVGEVQTITKSSSALRDVKWRETVC